MSFLTKIVSPALHEAAVRAGLRTALATLAPALVLPALPVGVITGQWIVAFLVGLALAVCTAFLAGLQSYASFLAKGIPEPYVTAAIEQAGYVPRHAAGSEENPIRAPGDIAQPSALSDAPIE